MKRFSYQHLQKDVSFCIKVNRGLIYLANSRRLENIVSFEVRLNVKE